MRPHKGGIEGKAPKLFLTPSPKGQIGICAMPGITFAKREGGGWGIRTMLEDCLEGAGTRKVVIAYDNEEKGDPKLPGYKADPTHRHDAQVWARYLARELIKDGHEARVAVLPKEWRDEKGKADWDGALARMLKPGDGPPAEIFAASAEKVRAEFYRVLRSAVRVEQFVEVPYFSKDAEALIYRRLERISYEPRLPLADGAEKIVIKKLSAFLQECKAKPGRLCDGALSFVASLLKQYRRLTGGYYIYRPLPSKANPAPNENYRENWLERYRFAAHRRDYDLRWVCELALKGTPKQISDFYIRPYYNLRKVSGELVRLVRIFNVHGEKTDLLALDGDAISAPKDFRKWLNKRFNATWGARETELQYLQFDLAHAVTHREVQEVALRGWHTESLHWFYGDCAYRNEGGKEILPHQSIFWDHGVRYLLSDKDQEEEPFCQGAPLLKPNEVFSLEGIPEVESLRIFFQETSLKFKETLEGYDGYLVLGLISAYGAAPEIFARYHAFPGSWLQGELGQGKSSQARWLLRYWGFNATSGLSLKDCTKVGISIAVQQYSNLPVWLEEFQSDSPPELIEKIKNLFNRESGIKKTHGEPKRQVRTSVVITGAVSCTDAQVRSRYPHILVSAARRQADHYRWLEDHSPNFRFLGRHIMKNRQEFSQQVLKVLDTWMEHPELKSVDPRARLVYGIAYAAFVAMVALLQSHEASDLLAFRASLMAQCGSAAKEVKAEAHLELFWRHFLFCYRLGVFGKTREELRTLFHVVSEDLPYPPGAPGQGPWKKYKLYFLPTEVIGLMKEQLARQRESLALSQVDLRAQMSTRPYWIPGKPQQRFGSGRAYCWGIDLDKFEELGYTPASDEALAQSREGKSGQ